jgi:very-short-patch-repair endonuclease
MPSPKIDTARRLRNNMTNVEWRLWSRLRSRQLGARFRRQHPIGPYFADFASVQRRLVIEVDGDTHLEAYDQHRDAWLQARGWTVLHVTVQEIDESFEDVIAAIYSRLNGPFVGGDSGLLAPLLASPLRGEVNIDCSPPSLPPHYVGRLASTRPR